jgi:fluoroacetyl-CoA thioesterase
VNDCRRPAGTRRGCGLGGISAGFYRFGYHAVVTSNLHPGLKVGLSGSAELVVGEEHTAPRIGSGRIHVLATPVMINLIEAAALAAVEHLLAPGYQSLGTLLNVRHIAATPVGMRVRATAQVVRVDGRNLAFRVEARDLIGDRGDLIGDGTHERVVVNVERFDKRVQEKLQAMR